MERSCPGPATGAGSRSVVASRSCAGAESLAHRGARAHAAPAGLAPGEQADEAAAPRVPGRAAWGAGARGRALQGALARLPPQSIEGPTHRRQMGASSSSSSSALVGDAPPGTRAPAGGRCRARAPPRPWRPACPRGSRRSGPAPALRSSSSSSGLLRGPARERSRAWAHGRRDAAARDSRAERERQRPRAAALHLQGHAAILQQPVVGHVLAEGHLEGNLPHARRWLVVRLPQLMCGCMMG